MNANVRRKLLGTGLTVFIALNAAAFTSSVIAMQVFVKTLTGKTITLDVEPSDTIENVEAKLTQNLDAARPTRSIVAPNEELLFEGKALQGNRTLKSYNINKPSTLRWIIL